MQAAGRLSGDETFTAAFVATVKACAERLRASGIDPADYDVSAIAADVDDLRQALDLDRWWLLGTQGTMSRATSEYLRAYPDRAEGAFVDSPWFPDVDDLTGGIAGTRAALAELFTACADDSACDDAFPDLERTWQQALDRLDDTPLRGAFQAASGDTIDVVVGAPKLLRAARFALGGDGPTNAGLLPATIAAAHGEATSWLLATIAQDPTFCAGYRPFCVGQDGFSLGAYLTAFCRDQAPFIDDQALNAAVDGDSVYEAVFVHSPYRQACEAWDVPAADLTAAEPVDTDVPLLMLPGQFDSFSPPPWPKLKQPGCRGHGRSESPDRPTTPSVRRMRDHRPQPMGTTADDPARRGRLSRRPAARLQHRQLSQFGEGLDAGAISGRSANPEPGEGRGADRQVRQARISWGRPGGRARLPRRRPVPPPWPAARARSRAGWCRQSSRTP